MAGPEVVGELPLDCCSSDWSKDELDWETALQKLFNLY